MGKVRLGTTLMAVAGAMLSFAMPLRAAEPARGMEPVPERRADEGQGPYSKLVIRGATLIDGSGAPPRGPVDIVIEGNRIAEIRGAGTPGLPCSLAANRAMPRMNRRNRHVCAARFRRHART
jgi:hypothetical protein